MAQILGEQIAQEESFPFSCSSAGIAAAEGAQASPFAIAAMAERGLDLTKHRARQLTPPLLQNTDCIFVMTPMHRQQILLTYPNIQNKPRQLSEHPIADPFGCSIEEYRRCAAQLEEAIRLQFRNWKEQGTWKSE